MEVVLLADVKSLGKKGEVVKVAEGYARNFILPKKLGVEANAANLATLKAQKAAQAKIDAQELADAKALAERIEKASVTVSIKGGESGKTYGSVTNKEIAAALAQEIGEDVDKKKIVLDEPIKAFGTYEVNIKLHRQVSAKLSVKVVEA